MNEPVIPWEQMQAEIAQLREQVARLQHAQAGSDTADPPPPDFSSKLERLNYYRREDTQEWTLLTNRVNSYITSQAFLVSAYAASMANPDLRFRLCFPVIVSAIGIIASLRAYPGIDGACKIIQLWHDKKRKLLQDPCLIDFCDGRPEKLPDSLYHRCVSHLARRSKVGKRSRAAQGKPTACELGAAQDEEEHVDHIHVTSLYFSQIAPKLFGTAWGILLLLAVVLHFVHK